MALFAVHHVNVTDLGVSPPSGLFKDAPHSSSLESSTTVSTASTSAETLSILDIFSSLIHFNFNAKSLHKSCCSAIRSYIFL
jgi:hypothetical protein